MATDRRILELALKGLEAERDRIASEIGELRARIDGRLATIRGLREGLADKAKRPSGRRRRKMTAAQRKLISKRMKEAWARRKRAARQG